MKKTLILLLLLSVTALLGCGTQAPPPAEPEAEAITGAATLAAVAEEAILSKTACDCGGERVCYFELDRSDTVYDVRDCPHNPAHTKANMADFTEYEKTLCTGCDYADTVERTSELRWYCLQYPYPFDHSSFTYVFLDWPAEMPTEYL